MKKIMIAVAVAATFTSGAAMAQAGMGFKAGATRDAVVANAAKGFARMDQNGDGAFDATEVTAVLQARATKNGKEFKPAAAAKAISNNDGDGDGKVTLAEFQAAAGKRFDAADTNKNGTIDADEAKGGEGGE
ncbi:EF-hand domain-containing protein [Sphingomonas sp. R-74633]|uniref:EF-hand domain-containing protein n=1 Tax=Sphingomonas sp. R-74633 TaxID=2751188 RepID=UPI001C550995|nr:EF-hand domain-containing protein [Sphingomonas sp. R-74633]